MRRVTIGCMLLALAATTLLADESKKRPNPNYKVAKLPPGVNRVSQYTFRSLPAGVKQMTFTDGHKAYQFTWTPRGKFEVQSKARNDKNQKLAEYPSETAFKKRSGGTYKIYKEGLAREGLKVGKKGSKNDLTQKQIEAMLKRLDALRELVEQYKRITGRAELGLAATSASPALAHHLRIKGGALVTKVTGGLASRLGLEPHDVITSLAGQPVTSAATLDTALAKAIKLETVTVDYYRKGVKKTAKITVR